MRILINIVAFLFSGSVCIAQNLHPYAVWENQSTGNYWFVQLNANSGVKTNISVIPGMSAYVGGNKTCINTDSNYYHCVGLIGSVPHLFTIDIATGTTLYSPALTTNVVGLEYNCNDSTIYGIKNSGGFYSFVRVDPVTGLDFVVNPIVPANAYVSGSFTLDRVQNLYSFIGSISPGYSLISYKLPSGALQTNIPIAGNLAGYRYSCADSSVYALQESGSQYLLQKIKLNNGQITTVSALTGVTPGIVAETSTINSSGEYIYRGFNAQNAISIITVNLSIGAVVNIATTNDNAAGFETGICCYDTSSTTVGFNDLQKQERLHFYPNPVNDKLYIHSSGNIQHFRIYTVEGKFAGGSYNVTFSDTEADVSALEKGVYFFEVFFDSGKPFRGKFIKL